MSSVPINVWAIIVAAVINMIIGSLWFGPLFGKPWMKAAGITPEKITAHKAAGKSMTTSYVFMAIGSVVMALALAFLIPPFGAFFGLAGTWLGVFAGVFAWVGFVLPVTIGVVLWDEKSWMYWFITYSYNFVSFVVMAVLLACWM